MLNIRSETVVSYHSHQQDSALGCCLYSLRQMASCEDLTDYQFLSHLYECLAIAVDVNRKRFSGQPTAGQFFLEVTDLNLQIKSEILRYRGKQVKIQLYGSSVEDLNVDLVPDYDVMIFPTSDNLTIDDELIEYLPSNAMHVRIKGADNPLLQSCLVDNTGYVATSALKNFHPAIYEPNDIYGWRHEERI